MTYFDIIDSVLVVAALFTLLLRLHQWLRKLPKGSSPSRLQYLLRRIKLITYFTTQSRGACQYSLIVHVASSINIDHHLV
jgi:hypothetical protein